MSSIKELKLESRKTPNFVPAYSQARTLVVVCAGLILMWWGGISFDIPIPFLGAVVTDQETAVYLIGCVLAYGVFRLLIEWVQLEPARRNCWASWMDFAVTIIFAIAASWALLSELLPSFEWPPVSLLLSGGVIVFLGFQGGIHLGICFQNLFLIRSKEEARRLALPRVPFAVRASVYYLKVVAPPIIVVFFLVPYFESPLSHLWPLLLFGPALVVFSSVAICTLWPTRARPDGTKESRSDSIKGLRKIFDRHDAEYQVGGWDKRIPPHNAPLYTAAEQGDTAIVRRLLNEGADPNERNQNGWTALMIAAANQHPETVKMLLEQGASPNIINLFGRSALMYAALYGNTILVEQLIQFGAEVDLNESGDPNALGRAASEGRLDVVEILLQSGADPSVQGRDGRMALDYAQAEGHGQVAGVLRRTSLARENMPPNGNGDE